MLACVWAGMAVLPAVHSLQPAWRRGIPWCGLLRGRLGIRFRLVRRGDRCGHWLAEAVLPVAVLACWWATVIVWVVVGIAVVATGDQLCRGAQRAVHGLTRGTLFASGVARFTRALDASRGCTGGGVVPLRRSKVLTRSAGHLVWSSLRVSDCGRHWGRVAL